MRFNTAKEYKNKLQNKTCNLNYSFLRLLCNAARTQKRGD